MKLPLGCHFGFSLPLNFYILIKSFKYLASLQKKKKKPTVLSLSCYDRPLIWRAES